MPNESIGEIANGFHANQLVEGAAMCGGTAAAACAESAVVSLVWRETRSPQRARESARESVRKRGVAGRAIYDPVLDAS